MTAADRAPILIVGGSGFVGGHLLAACLKPGTTIPIHVSKLPSEPVEKQPGVTVHDLDILDSRAVARLVEALRPSRIVHLAAQSSVALSWQNPALTMSINYNGTVHLLAAVQKYVPDCRILIIGSSEQYGLIDPSCLPVMETQPRAPANPYAISKEAQERYALLMAQTGLHVLCVRSFNHIGPGQSPAFAVADFARQIVAIERGQQAPQLRVGNLAARRDFTDVRDVVRAYLLLLERGRAGAVYNVGSGFSVSMADVLQEMIRLSGHEINTVVDPERFRPLDQPDIVADNSLLRSTTGWRPEITLEQSLTDVLTWWRSQR